LCFFFKQKTAYESTYGDWSSDVCSSDLRRHVWLAHSPMACYNCGCYYDRAGEKWAAPTFLVV